MNVWFSHSRDATLGNSLMNVQMNADLKKNKKNIPMRASRGLKWQNKTNKLKRSIERRIQLRDCLLSNTV